MRVLVTGGKGMLGRTLQRRLDGCEVVVADLPEVDITRADAVDRFWRDVRPEVVVHAAAMTAVDACESDCDRAFAVNALGSAYVAAASQRVGARLVAVSTDYVFAGDADRPYHEWDAPGPRTVYGASKLAGEEAVRWHCPDHLVVRVAWLYGAGGPSFVHTMLKLGAQAGPPLRVVDDQRGNPTSCEAVAEALRELIDSAAVGTMHLTCEGETSWYAFTRAIFDRVGLARELEPCTSAEFPRPAPRPANSCLEKRVRRLSGLPPMPDWREDLDRFLAMHPQG